MVPRPPNLEARSFDCIYIYILECIDFNVCLTEYASMLVARDGGEDDDRHRANGSLVAIARTTRAHLTVITMYKDVTKNRYGQTIVALLIYIQSLIKVDMRSLETMSSRHSTTFPFSILLFMYINICRREFMKTLFICMC